MSGQDFQDKTEKATPKKRSEAKNRGQVAKSREISSVAVLLAGFGSLMAFGGFMYHQIEIVTRNCFIIIQKPFFDLRNVMEIFYDVVLRYIIIVLPMMSGILLVSVIANILQFGLIFSTETLKPDLNKINPLKGIEKLFSKNALMEVLKSLGKIVLIGFISYKTIKGEIDNFNSLTDQEIISISIYIIEMMLKIFFRVCLAMIVIGIIDYVYQKWQYETQLKMTKQEVKEEFKSTEGDPIVKSRIRRVQQEIARKRMMQEVPNADVIVTNPIHLAVAIKYNSATMAVPKVVAKGAEKLAEKIKAIAKENNVPIIENKLLAQDLFKNVDIGEEIPSNIYQAVAEVLAYVYRLKEKMA